MPWKAEAILQGLGEFYCAEITDAAMCDLADEIWPDGVSPKTLNRHLYSPVISILQVSLKHKKPHLERPKGHREITPVIIPPEEWYEQLAPNLSADQLAVFMFLFMHGRRLGEALSRTPKDLNLEKGVLDLGRTKTGVRILDLNPKCIPFLARPGWQYRKWMFGCGPNSANSFRRDFKHRCEKNGLPYYTPHSFGRHMSVTRMLRAGYSTKYVADAHGMTEEMVARRYGHLTRGETTEALHKVGGELFDRVMTATPHLLSAPVELQVVYNSERDAVENTGELMGNEEEFLESIRLRNASKDVDPEEKTA